MNLTVDLNRMRSFVPLLLLVGSIVLARTPAAFAKEDLVKCMELAKEKCAPNDLLEDAKIGLKKSPIPILINGKPLEIPTKEEDRAAFLGSILKQTLPDELKLVGKLMFCGMGNYVKKKCAKGTVAALAETCGVEGLSEDKIKAECPEAMFKGLRANKNAA